MKYLGIAFSSAVIILAGAVAHHLRVPLGWMLGPLVAAAALSVLGMRFYAPIQGRKFGQLVIGTAIGLNMSPEVVARLLSWLPVMLVVTVLSILVCAAASVLFARIARVDTVSAYYAMLPGGLAEMASVGEAQGGRADVIALSQTFRVALTVLLMPPLVWLVLGNPEPAQPHDSALIDWPVLLMMLGFGTVVVHILIAIRLVNPWMIGSLVAASILTSLGLVEGHVPTVLLWIGQLFIGAFIGARFKRDILARLGRVAWGSALMLLVSGAVLMGTAAICAAIFPLGFATWALIMAPGGLAEMTLTAETMGLDIAIVAAFHIFRVFLVNAFGLAFWGWLDRVGYFRLLGVRRG